jgi:hypothetical protein
MGPAIVRAHLAGQSHGGSAIELPAWIGRFDLFGYPPGRVERIIVAALVGLRLM